jgi:hypothetical protein
MTLTSRIQLGEKTFRDIARRFANVIAQTSRPGLSISELEPAMSRACYRAAERLCGRSLITSLDSRGISVSVAANVDDDEPLCCFPRVAGCRHGLTSTLANLSASRRWRQIG